MKEIFLKKPVPFSDKRDVNWSAVRNIGIGVVTVAVIVIVALPSRDNVERFKNSGDRPGSEMSVLPVERGPQTVDFRGYSAAMGSNMGSSGRSPHDLGSAMVVARDGLDSQTQIPPGSRIRFRLLERAVVGTQGIPVIGIVIQDFEQEGFVAVPRGSKLFGEISYDKDSKRGQITWRSIQIGTSRIRTFDATSTSTDGRAGVDGQIHSDAMKNMAGQLITRFIGAYASGSMQKTTFFGSPGGHENGLKNAMAETAKDQADRLAEDMKKEREWLEVTPDQEFLALLTQPFRFRDPGGSYRE